MDDMKPIIWVGDSLKQVRNFPPEVRREIGVTLFDAQSGHDCLDLTNMGGLDETL